MFSVPLEGVMSNVQTLGGVGCGSPGTRACGLMLARLMSVGQLSIWVVEPHLVWFMVHCLVCVPANHLV